MAVLLGIDTGGTYTDAVLFCEQRGVIAKAKSLTTRHDLSEGISAAASMVLDQAEEPISLVSLSTTLATNALVEGQGGSVGLVMIGFDEKDMAKAGLNEALSGDPVVFIQGGHDVHGRETPLKTDGLAETVGNLADGVTAFAIAGYFAVRNPAHEISVRDLISEQTGLPVTCSHELSAKLNGPKRAVTSVLNARLISMISRLIAATEKFLETRGITAPLMVVRGDGALVSAEFAKQRPIETILSGPAASLVGAHYLTGASDAIISDIGGTTTDIAILKGGVPAIDENGAKVGGFTTMVEAVAMRTHGLGGDSEVQVETTGLNTKIILGPRRVLPTSLLAQRFPQILPILKRQMEADFPGRNDGIFVLRSGTLNTMSGLSEKEAEIFARIDVNPKPLGEVLTSSRERSILDRLVRRGFIHLSGFTPSDAAHVLNEQENWNREGAEYAAGIFAKNRNGAGNAVAANIETAARIVVHALERRSAEVILDTALEEDGYPPSVRSDNEVIQRMLSGITGIAAPSLALDRPVIGLGASAGLYYPGIGKLLNTQTLVPEHADVANAVGAVVGNVRLHVTAVITQPSEGSFHIVCGERIDHATDEAAAIGMATELAKETALLQAEQAGATTPTLTTGIDVQASEEAGNRTFVQAEITVTATGRPVMATNQSRT